LAGEASGQRASEDERKDKNTQMSKTNSIRKYKCLACGEKFRLKMSLYHHKCKGFISSKDKE